VAGVVVYTGKETKLVMNSRKAPFKVSFIEKTMNHIIIVIFFAQIILSVLSMIAHMVWTDTYYSSLYYLCYDATTLETYDTTLYNECLTTTTDFSSGSYFFTFFILYRSVARFHDMMDGGDTCSAVVF
jgi:magnesium-transporting ATPase (P-type)